MYRYSINRQKKNNKNSHSFLISLGQAVAVVGLVCALGHGSEKVLGYVSYIIVLLLILAAVTANGCYRRGKFVADNRYAHSINELNSPRVHWAEVSDEGALSAVLKHLTGTPVEPMPYGRSVWKVEHFNKNLNEMYLVLEWHDPFLKNFSNSRIALKVTTELFPNRIKLTTKYAIPTPLRSKVSRHIISVTERSIEEFLLLLEKGQNDSMPLFTHGVDELTENVTVNNPATGMPPSAVPVIAPPGLNYTFLASNFEG